MPLMPFPSAMQLMYSRLPLDIGEQSPFVQPLPKPPDDPFLATMPTYRTYWTVPLPTLPPLMIGTAPGAAANVIQAPAVPDLVGRRPE